VAHPKAEEILGQFSFLGEYGRRMEVPEGFVVIRDGDGAGSMFFILEGLVEVTKEERLLAVLEPGEVFGEMSMVDGRPRSANVAALQPTQLIRIDRDGLLVAGCIVDDDGAALSAVYSYLEPTVPARSPCAPAVYSQLLSGLGAARRDFS